MAARTITVDLADRSYPIVIGRTLLDGNCDLATHLPGSDCLVVSNETVGPLYLERLVENFPGCNVEAMLLPDGEAWKTLESAATILDRLVEIKARRDTTLVALGGGVVGDIAGFAAACYMRGIAFIQVPTTLLAQVDSSVGGKTGVNHAGGKNLIGAFHQPRLVLIDTDTLASLPEREFCAGLAEVIKHGAIADAGFFAWLEQNIRALLAKDPEALAHAIGRSCEIKASIVSEDETEQGRRALLNFGHTFAHAIENSLGYGEWLHGEAVAAGMVMAAQLSDIDQNDRDRLQLLLNAAGLPVTPPPLGSDRVRAAMQLDKKARSGQLRFVLLDRLGEASLVSEISGVRLADILKGIAPTTTGTT
ncbi:MAG TPA: 3-dehydroquinate synthase [Woeseiaceae bacterium]|nr:3-dehydroquinate synthase [Woeseiaceae bacterium]